ncbi:MAG: hypothetical protein KC609_11300 [Myxococcales bacterium]|nr:hypothetical protein [Myxococcales bacterium]
MSTRPKHVVPILGSADDLRGQYIVVTTARSEYHLSDGVCFGVRNRATGRWSHPHPAQGMRVTGYLTRNQGRTFRSHDLVMGVRLLFENQISTTPVDGWFWGEREVA